MKTTPEFAIGLRDFHLKQWEYEHPATLTTIRAMPEAQLTYTPHEKSAPYNTLAKHIYEAGLFFLRVINGDEQPGQPEAEAPTTMDLLIANCEKLNREFIEGYNKLSADQLCAEYQFYYMGKFVGCELIDWHLRHMIHHRAQLQTYLRTLNLPCPSIYGPTADVSGEELAKQFAAK